MTPGQRCVLSMGDTTAVFTTKTGTFAETTYGGPVAARIGGVTDDDRYVSVHFQGTVGRRGQDPWCDAM